MNKRTWVIAVNTMAIGFTSHLCLAADAVRSYPVKPVPFTNVEITGDFWKTRLDVHTDNTIAHVLDQCEKTGRINNFRIAAGQKEGEFEGSFFNDSDVYKILEGMAYSLKGPMKEEHRKFLDEFIAIMGKAQMDDGYLYTFYQVKKEMNRQWKDIGNMHELYCAGHMIEAGTAHYQATGKKDLLNICIKFADMIDKQFGPGRQMDPPGHQEIELALVKLYQTTGDEKYLKLAKFFLDQRGRNGNWYDQNHIPLVEQSEAVGHAVRAVYGYAGMTDVAALTGDEKYTQAVNRLWESVVGKKLAVSGGIGGGLWEAFDKEYFLPNSSAYNETCGAIAMVLWSQRMFQLYGDAKYIDVLERALYNGALTGVSLQGDAFNYPNPLKTGGGKRQPWFGCACCPSSIARIIPALPGYQYAQKENTIYVNLFASSRMNVEISGKPVVITQQTQYPWDGRVRLEVAPKSGSKFTVALRIPGWAHNQPLPSDLYTCLDKPAEPVKISVNGKAVPCTTVKGFVEITRTWDKSDVIEMNIPMPVRRVIANEKVKDDTGLVALERGPVLYCVEGMDNEGADNKVSNILIPDTAEFVAEYKKDLLSGVTVITGDAKIVTRAEDGINRKEALCQMTAVPYFARANRKDTPMAVWLLRDAARAILPPVADIASTSKISSSSKGGNFRALNDQITPARSADAANGVYNFGGEIGTTQWVQYEFKEPTEISSSQVYWYDRFGTIERKPKAWRLLYKEGDQWIPVKNNEPYDVKLDEFSKVTFKPVKTTALRLEATMQDAFLDPYLALPTTAPAKFATSALEWSVH